MNKTPPDSPPNYTGIKSESPSPLDTDEVESETSFPELDNNMGIKTEFPIEQHLHETVKRESPVQEDDVDSRPQTHEGSNERESPTQKEDIEIEIEVEDRQRLFRCSKCKKQFTSKTNAKAHIDAIHYKLKPFSCTNCKRSFSKKSSLTAHLAAFDNGTRCAGKHPAYQEKVEIVSEIYNGQNSFKCMKCGKRFTKKPSAVTHINVIHYGMKPFSCEVCQKSFSKRSNYLNHLNAIHENVRHTCSHCNKSFSRKSSLTAHLVAHDNIFHNKRKTYPCGNCRRSFTHKTSLNRHIMEKHNSGGGKTETPSRIEDNLNYYEDIEPAIHNEESSFKCRKCDKHFTTKRSAIAHIKQVRNIV